MRNYIILNGVNSSTITGLLIQTLPPISKPKQRVNIEEIDGRDGDIVTYLGYGAYDKEFKIGLYGSYDVDQIIEYFNSQGTVIFSNEEDKYYNYQIVEQIDYDKLLRYKEATIKMHVQPFKYPTEETPVEIEYQYVTGEGTDITLDNTDSALMELELNPSELTQETTPTPDNPSDVQVIKGNNSIKIENKNLFTSELTYGRAWNNSNGTGDVWSGQYARTSDFIKVKPNTTYTISFVSKGNSKSGNILSYTSSQSFINSVVLDTNLTFTTSSTTYYVKFNFYNGSGYTTGDIYNLQLENNNSATSYVAHQEQVLPLNLPVENLIPTNENAWEQGTISSADGTNSSSTARIRTIDYYTIKPGSYSLSIQNSTYCWLNIIYYDSNKNYITSQALISSIDGLQNAQITTPSNTKYFRATIKIDNSTTILPSDINLAKPQIELGSKTNQYTPYGTTTIEYCKIGDYADSFEHDLENDKWYINKAIGKVVWDGTTNPNKNSGDSSNYLYYYPTSERLKDTPIICDKLTHKALANINTGNTLEAVGISTLTTNSVLYFNVGYYISTNTPAGVSAYLSSDNITTYYVLSTPTHTEITDTTLISQLNAILEAVSYDGQTNISQTNTGLPFIISASALKKGSNTATVNNTGNIYSKPTIDIEGSGTVDIYLNNNQMFSVDLSNSNECVIDTTNLEAYNPSTSALMNRQVTGDYSNFKFNTGENTVKVNGNVTKVTITDYTRWL